MLHGWRVFPFALALALTTGCAPFSTEERLERLEAQMQVTQVYDLRIANVEDRLTLLEQDLGRSRSQDAVPAGAPAGKAEPVLMTAPRRVEPYATEPAPAPRKVEPRAIEPAAVAPRMIEPDTPVPVAAMPEASAPGRAVPAPIAPLHDLTGSTVSPGRPVFDFGVPLPPPPPGKPADEPRNAGDTAPSASASSAGSVEAALADLGSDAAETLASRPSSASAAPSSPSPSVSPAAQAELSDPPPGYTHGPRRVEPSVSLALPDRPEAGASARTAAGRLEPKRSAASPKAAYDRALALFESRKYTESKAAFEAFAAANPKSSLMPNALYWMGECLYSQGDYSGSIFKFKDVAGNYPTHHKAAAALLKAGYAYAQLGDMNNARFYWQMLTHDFPGSTEAKLAAKRMESGR